MPRSAMAHLPPQPPDRAPRVRLSLAQRIGLPLMALLPLLALAGFFGERRTERQGTRGALLISAQVPARFRYGQRMTVTLSVTNRGAAAMNDVRIRIDSSYLNRFSNVVLSPSAAPDGWVRIDSLGAHESVQLRASVEGERTGAHRGDAIATDARGDTARVALASIVFP